MSDDRPVPASSSRPLASGIVIAVRIVLGYIIAAGAVAFADGSSWGALTKC